MTPVVVGIVSPAVAGYDSAEAAGRVDSDLTCKSAH